MHLSGTNGSVAEQQSGERLAKLLCVGALVPTKRRVEDHSIKDGVGIPPLHGFLKAGSRKGQATARLRQILGGRSVERAPVVAG
jgi:hypothetical protein